MRFQTTVYGSTFTEVRDEASREVDRFFGSPTPYEVVGIRPHETLTRRDGDGSIYGYSIIYEADVRVPLEGEI